MMRAMPHYAERRLTHQMRVVELRFGTSVPILLRELRIEGLNGVQVAGRLDIPYGTLRRWLVRFGLDDASLIRRGLWEAGGGEPRVAGEETARLAVATSTEGRTDDAQAD